LPGFVEVKITVTCRRVLGYRLAVIGVTRQRSLGYRLALILVAD